MQKSENFQKSACVQSLASTANFLLTKQIKSNSKRHYNVDIYGAHLTTLEIVFYADEDAKENEPSPNVVLPCVDLL